MRAPFPTGVPRPRRACLPAVAGLVALLAGPALAADDLAPTAHGDLTDPAVAQPAGHPASGPHAVPVSAVPPAPQPALATAMPDEAAAQGEAPADEAAPEAAPAAPYRYQARGLRDPFALPAEVRAPMAGTENVPPLERHALSDFRLVAVVKGARSSFAMVTTIDGKGYTLRVGTRIGTDGGRVRQISKNSVVVEVVRPDEFGELKKSETILALRPEEVVP